MELCQKINHLFGGTDNQTMDKRTANGTLKRKTPDLNQMSTSAGLRLLYESRVLPMEREYFFNEFHSPRLEAADFEAKPTILMVGQYSTGKTTFIKYLMDSTYPGIRIGPEPTTDRFIVVMHNQTEGVIPGNALVTDADKRFRSLKKYGNAFLNRLQISEAKSKVLESITFVDTPGILSGEKQRIDRGYDFPGVLQWFAERVDRIILMFDANKLDISDEMKTSIEALTGFEHKMRIVLNKSDVIDEHQLMRVYGALMWSLAKVLTTPEAIRVHIGSFWDRPLVYEANRQLFENEERDLLCDIMTLPRDSRIRLLNDIIQRSRLVRVHSLIICALKDRMPLFFNKKSKQKQLIQHLRDIYIEIHTKYGIPLADFPNMRSMQQKLKSFDFRRFTAFDKKLFDQIERMFVDFVPKLMTRIASEQISTPIDQIKGGKFEEINGPFSYRKGEGVDAGSLDNEWIVSKNKDEYDKQFQALKPIKGKISSTSAKSELVKSKLPSSVLSRIYRLSDVDGDGMLDADEFALAIHLVKVKLAGHDLPFVLPDHLVPPSKRH